MKKNISSLLRRILNDTAAETALARSKESMKRVKQMVKDALPLLSFEDALSTGNALIAEIKERSPSQGKMIPGNVKVAPVAYKESRLVKAISVLTNRSHFGKSMGVNELWRIKEITNKPVLRKDFITDEYQAYQARAYGADAILLMANILEADELKKLSDIAFELGMDVLFETHCAEELESLPSTARIVGINCRNFDAHPLNPVSGFAVSKFFRQWLGKSTDKSTN